MSWGQGPEMFSGLTSKELQVLGAKLDHGGLAAGDRLFPDRNMETEILALSAEVHDLAQRRLEAEAGEPEIEPLG
jgi:hypothetical protein